MVVSAAEGQGLRTGGLQEGQHSGLAAFRQGRQEGSGEGRPEAGRSQTEGPACVEWGGTGDTGCWVWG